MNEKIARSDEVLGLDDMTAEQLIEGFNPLDNKIDRRILYEITGRKVDQDDYWDDSDQDLNVDRHQYDPSQVSDSAADYQLMRERNDYVERQTFESNFSGPE